MTGKSLKVLGLVATVGGAVFSVIGNIVGEKKQNAKIEETVLKVVSDKMKES